MNIVKNILNLIENMTILELKDMIDQLENKYNFNFKNSDSKLNKNEELNVKNDNYTLHLIDFGKNKVSVIKIVKEINNLNLKEAKDLVESAPVILKDNIDTNSCNIIKDKLENVGAKIKIEEKKNV